jgi:antitoxin ParD1/3/4/toxin ParE1/3/4
MSAYILLPPAREDLLEIWEYIRARSNDEGRADAVIDDITAAFIHLVSYPHSGSVHADVLDPPHRFWPVHSWEIIYRPDTDPLEIVRILSGYRDLPRIL